MKIAFICDTHLPNNQNSAQYAYLTEIIKRMREDKIETVISVGDITSFGEKEIFMQHLEDLKGFDHQYVIGNAEVRNEATKGFFLEASKGFLIERGGRRFLGVDTPYDKIEERDRERARTLSDGDVLVMHNYVESLEKDSREFVIRLCEEKALTVIHAHSHMRRDYALGRSRVIGLRALDPDKSIGGYPCIDYIEFDGGQVAYEEVLIKNPVDVLKDLRAHFGISCVDNLRDLTYALENNVYAVEIRTNGADWTPDLSLIPLIEKWRAKTGGYLSVHFPNLGYKNGEITGKEQWYAATEYAIAIQADGLTMHPPRRVRVCDMPCGGKLWNEFLEIYLYTVKRIPAHVRVGIENMHIEAGEGKNEQRSFGYTPAEVSALIDALNDAMSDPGRVGHILDVGHARNNGHLASTYPISRWYEIMGQRTVAYHIHQVLAAEKGMKNHNAIENWLGPIINYASFFYSWEKKVINHRPVFLEVQGCVNYQKSIEAFERLLRDAKDLL
ncbi:MAG: metallophosphoesterase family protein [Clostridia bacterium]|nr:metallophosphoesterase family protein [Clostridia bacterium]